MASRSTMFETLHSVLKGDLILRGAPTYINAIGGWSKLAERQAAAVVYVRNEEDVGHTRRFARDHSLEAAVKGGGHNTSGASSTEGGIVIDLSRYMIEVDVNVSTKRATVGGGALWRNVDDATYACGHGAVGGTVNDTGVGGLTLGGGYGVLTGQHGLVMLGVTMVLADGRIVRANGQEHENLFWAIRGGGVNFGVVTRFEFCIHPMPPQCWSGPLFFTLDKLDAVLEAVNHWKAADMSPLTCGLLGIIRDVEKQTTSLMVVCTYVGPPNDARKYFAPLLDIGPHDDRTREKPYPELNVDPDVPAGRFYHYSSGAVHTITREAVERVIEAQAQLVEEIPDVTPFIGIELYPTDRICAVPTDATAFAARGHHSNFFVDINWDEGDRDLARIRYHGRAIANAMTAAGAETAHMCGNYEAEVRGEARSRRLFGANYTKLQTIKAIYEYACCPNG